MGKPPIDVFNKFKDKFYELSKKAGKKQYLVPTCNSQPATIPERCGLPGPAFLQKPYAAGTGAGFLPHPRPQVGACVYTGLDPYTLKPVFVEKSAEGEALQRALLHALSPANAEKVMQGSAHHPPGGSDPAAGAGSRRGGAGPQSRKCTGQHPPDGRACTRETNGSGKKPRAPAPVCPTAEGNTYQQKESTTWNFEKEKVSFAALARLAALALAAALALGGVLPCGSVRPDRTGSGALGDPGEGLTASTLLMWGRR